MTPEQLTEFNKMKEQLAMFEASDRYTVQKLMQIFDGRNIQLGKTTGTKIATATDQKLSFHGVTPVIQASAITAPTGGATVDTEARTAINSIRTALSGKGIISA